MTIAGTHQPERVTRGFSLIELVIVVVIIGVIGAIAIPRLSRGAEGASEAALAQSLAVLNKATDHYAAEHMGQYPDQDKIEQQLTQYTDIHGNVSATKTTTHIFGPYLRSIPEAPVEEDPGDRLIAPADQGGAAWLFDRATGKITFDPDYTEG